jgi:hypothetical protein
VISEVGRGRKKGKLTERMEPRRIQKKRGENAADLESQLNPGNKLVYCSNIF